MHPDAPASPSRRLPVPPPLPLPCGKRVFCTVFFFMDTRHARAWRSSATQLLSRPMAPGHVQTSSRRRHSALAPTSARRAHRPHCCLATALPLCRGQTLPRACVAGQLRRPPVSRRADATRRRVSACRDVLRRRRAPEQGHRCAMRPAP